MRIEFSLWPVEEGAVEEVVEAEEEVVDFASWQEEAPIEEEVRVEEGGQMEDVHVEEAQMPRGRKTTTLQREAAALSCELGLYWSKVSPRCLRRSTRVGKQPDHFIPSF